MQNLVNGFDRHLGVLLLVVMTLVIYGCAPVQKTVAGPKVTITCGFTDNGEAITAQQSNVVVYDLVYWPNGEILIPVGTGNTNQSYEAVATTSGKILRAPLTYWRYGPSPRLYLANGYYILEAPFSATPPPSE